MIFKVYYTADALQDLQGIHNYIAWTLLEPITATKQSDRIMNAVDSLNEMPFRCRLYNKEPWQSRGLRILPVENFLVLFYPDEEKRHVTIIRILYARRDVENLLSESGNKL